MGRPTTLDLGVYVLTSSGLVPGREHVDVARAAIEGGAGAIQLRAPELDDEALLPLAREISELCIDAGVLFVVNNRLGVALASAAGSVHLGQGDDRVYVRKRAGDLVLGVSVETPEQAREAEEAGADYLGVVVWATHTKPQSRGFGPDGLRAIVRATSLPVVGIGGIDAGNAAEVLATGAAGVAVVSAVGSAPDPTEATTALVQLVERARSEGTRA